MIVDNAAAPHLLVVDDDALLCSMAARTLRHAGFEVTTVDCGEQALAIFEHAHFSLLLLDVVMPGIDGYEVCMRLRRSAQGAALPILMLTGLNDTESIEQAYEAGATDFIAKPINWTLLSQRVRYALRAAQAAASASRNRERLERAQQIARMGSWKMACSGEAMTASAALGALLAAPEQGGWRMSAAAFLERVHPDDRAVVQAARHAALQSGTPYQLNFRIRRFDGAERTVYEQAQPVCDTGGRQLAVEGITQDITERVEAERRISHLAHFDVVTGLPNRAFFIELAAPALERAARLGSVCALLHVDIDRFKSVNDAFGQAKGDAVLKLLAERIQASVRSADVASVGQGAQPCIARVGANAFTLLLVEVGGDRQAGLVAERLMAAVAMPIEIDDRELSITASVGIALYPRDAGEARALARCGEQAVYAAKSGGRAQQRFFDEAMNATASMQLQLESELRHGIAAGQLLLHYQPKVDASRGLIIGVEALVRWQHPERGLVPPGAFIGVAEECGLIAPLTDWVLATACADLRRRADAGLPAVPVSVNLASPTFLREGLLEQLVGLLQRYRLEAHHLTLEVTESLLMKDVPLAVQRLQQLRERGFRLSLDDFGTGYSSLSYLKRFPIDELKIDRSFISDVCRGGRDGAIARSVIALGREFGLHVVAEGVETLAQAQFLLRHGCTSQQGFLFARPMPVAPFDALLEQGTIEVPGLRAQATALVMR